MTHDFDEAACLSYDPFAGDFGSPSDRLLADKIVTAAKAHDRCCNICGGSIAKGERHRSRREIVDGEKMSHRFCGPCCVAMATSWDDEGAEIDRRTSMHPAWAHLKADADDGPPEPAGEQ